MVLKYLNAYIRRRCFLKGALRISEAASLALHTMVFMSADPGRFYSTREIAERLSVSGAHLAKVLQRLARVGLVKSARGPRGGFKLGKNIEDVSLLDVFEAIEGHFEPRECLMMERSCNGTECLLGELLEKINTSFREYLGGMRLAKLKGIYGIPEK